MASNVNVRFVAILVLVVLTLTGGVIFVGMKSLKSSATDNIADGDTALAEGDVRGAVRFYSKAVAKAQQNPDYLRKWIGAMEQYVPTTRQRYQDDYISEYRPALEALAFAEGTNIDSHARAIEEYYRNFGLGGGSLASGENVIAVTAKHLEEFPDGPGPHDRLLRYPGMARVAMLANGIEVPSEDIELAREQLERALAVDPDDGEVLGGLATWHLLRADRLRADRFEESVIAEADQQAKQLMADFIREHPPAVRIRLAKLGMEIAELGRSDPFALTDQDEVAARFADDIAAIHAGALSIPPAEIDRNMVGMVTQRLRSLGEDARSKSTEIVEHALKQNENDASLLLLYGRSLAAEGRTDEALVVFEKVAELPDLPLSLDGLVLFAQRHDALQAQCEAALARWEAAETDEDRDAALANAQELRDQLLREVGETYRPLLFLDARLAYITGNLRESKLKLQTFNDLTGESNAQAMSLLGQILLQERNYGGARDQYERVIRLRPFDRRALTALGEISSRLNEYPAALGYYQQLLALDPANEDLADRVANLEALVSGGGNDPILRVLVRAQEMADALPPDVDGAIDLVRGAIEELGPEPRLVLVLGGILGAREGAERDEAIELLTRAIEASPNDLRLVEQLATIYQRNENQEAAIALLDQAVAQNPDNEALARYAESLRSADPVQDAIATIESDEGLDEYQKHVLKYRQLTSVGRPEEAAAELDAAAALRPEEPFVVMQLFERARLAMDVEEMRRLAELGRATNADNVDGLSFRAMVEMADGKLDDAVRTMERALDADRLNPRVWAGLGRVQLVLGRHGDAEQSYEEALALRPQDVPAAIGIVQSIVQSGDFLRGLARARELRSVGRTNAEFLELWLTLESEVPTGDRLAALRTRQRIAENTPDNIGNKTALARLLIQEERYADADPLLTELVEQKPSIRTVDLRARWHAMQGDLDGAARTYMDFAADHPDDTRSVDIYSVAAQLYVEFERPDIALSILEQGRPHQTAGVLECDQDRAKVLFDLGRHAEAEEAYAALLEGMDEDPDRKIRKRLVECLILQEKFAQADSVIMELGSEVNVDADLLLLRAEVASGVGERDRARRLFDEAIAAAPESPSGYLRRARFNLMDRDMMSDAEADLEQALRLRPGLVAAMATLADVYIFSGRMDEAVDLRAQVVQQNPMNIDRRLELAQLLRFRERGPEALRLLGEGVVLMPRSVRLLNATGEMAFDLEQWDDARLAQKAAWEVRQTPQTATLYVKTLLESPDPDPQAALAVLADEGAETERYPSTLLLRARANQLANRLPETEADIVAAYRALDVNSREQVGSFFQGMAYIFPNPEGRAKAVLKIDGGSSFGGWMGLTLAEFLGTVPAYRSQAVELLTQFSQQPLEPELKVATHRRLGGYLYGEGDFEGAASQFQAALDVDPTNGAVMNDLAYTIGYELRRVDEALPIAEEAAALLPSTPNVLDTLGKLQLMAGDLDAARTTLESAEQFARRDWERVPIYVHLVELHLADGDDRGARRYLDYLDDVERRTPEALGPHSDEVADLRRRVGG